MFTEHEKEIDKLASFSKLQEEINQEDSNISTRTLRTLAKVQVSGLPQYNFDGHKRCIVTGCIITLGSGVCFDPGDLTIYSDLCDLCDSLTVWSFRQGHHVVVDRSKVYIFD